MRQLTGRHFALDSCLADNAPFLLQRMSHTHAFTLPCTHPIVSTYAPQPPNMPLAPRMYVNLEDYLYYNQGRRANKQFRAIMATFTNNTACTSRWGHPGARGVEVFRRWTSAAGREAVGTRHQRRLKEHDHCSCEQQAPPASNATSPSRLPPPSLFLSLSLRGPVRLHWGKAGWPDPGCWRGDEMFGDNWCSFG